MREENGSREGVDDREDRDEGDNTDETEDVTHPVRRGSVDLRTLDGDSVHHDEAFVRYTPEAFVVSVDRSFPPESTEHYSKRAVAWIQVRHPRR